MSRAGSTGPTSPRGAAADPADRGSVTVEAAVALSAVVVVLVGCLTGLACVIAQLRCTDAAREAARLAARGDLAAARSAAAGLAPSGFSLSLDDDGDLVSASVAGPAVGGMLPGVRISAIQVAAREPGEASGASR